MSHFTCIISQYFINIVTLKKKTTHALHLENRSCWNTAFFSLSKHKLNIYETKYIETIAILVGVEWILRRIQPELDSLTYIKSDCA